MAAKPTTSRKIVVVALLSLFVAFLIGALSIALPIMKAFPRKTDTEYYGEIHSKCVGSFLPLKDEPRAPLTDPSALRKWNAERIEKDEKIKKIYSYCNCIVTQAAKRLPPPEEAPLDLKSPEGAAKLTELAEPCMAELRQ